MYHCIFDKTTNQMAGHARWDPPTHDPDTQVVITLDDLPDREADRWDGANGIRPATSAEAADRQSADAAQKAQAQTTTPMATAIIDLFYDMERRLAMLEGNELTTRADVAARLEAALTTAERDRQP